MGFYYELTYRTNLWRINLWGSSENHQPDETEMQMLFNFDDIRDWKWSWQAYIRICS